MIQSTLPYALFTSLNLGASMVTVVISDTLWLMGSPVAFLEESRQLGRVSQDYLLKKVLSARGCKMEIESGSRVLQDHDALRKISGKRGSIARSRAKMCTSGANSVGSKIRGKNARRIHETGALRSQRRRYVLLYCRSVGNASTLFDKSRSA